MLKSLLSNIILISILFYKYLSLHNIHYRKLYVKTNNKTKNYNIPAKCIIINNSFSLAVCSLYINENDTIKQRILDQEETNAIKSFSEWSFHLLMAISSLLFVIPIYYESLVIPFYIVGIVIYVISLIKMLPWAKLNSNHKRKT